MSAVPPVQATSAHWAGVRLQPASLSTVVEKGALREFLLEGFPAFPERPLSGSF